MVKKYKMFILCLFLISNFMIGDENMALTRPTWATNNISSLANQVTGQGTALKAAFDKPSVDIKAYDSTLCDEIEAQFVTKTDLTTSRKLSATGDFTGTINGGPITASEQGLEATVNVHLSDSATNVKSFGAKGDGTTDDTVAIQTAINYAALHNKTLYMPSGVYCISSPLQLPYGSSSWGLEISGAKSETKYQYLPSSTSTIIKATAIMSSIIANRGTDEATDVAYYNVVKNLVLDGNQLAVRGYINGWQDKLIDCSVISCTAYSVSLGSMTNSTVLHGITMALSAKGFESIGANTTTWYMDNCQIRENTLDGATITSSKGAKITNTIIESNGGKGVDLIGGTVSTATIAGLVFDNVHFEANTDYAINSDKTGTYIPRNIDFKNITIDTITNKAVNLVNSESVFFHKPKFYGTPSTTGYFIAQNALFTEITARDDEMLGLSITGTGANNVIKNMIKSAAPYGQKINNIVQANIFKNEIIITASKTLTIEECSGTIITNYGQGANDVDVVLPQSTGIGCSFKVICATASANHLRFAINDGGSQNILLNGGTGKWWIQNSTPIEGDCIEFTAVLLASKGWCWIATPIVGTWTSY